MFNVSVRSSLQFTLLVISLLLLHSTTIPLVSAQVDGDIPPMPEVTDVPPIDVPLPETATTLTDFLPFPVQEIPVTKGGVVRSAPLNPLGDAVLFGESVAVIVGANTFSEAVTLDYVQGETAVVTQDIYLLDEEGFATENKPENRNENGDLVLDSTQAVTLLQFEIEAVTLDGATIYHEFDKHVRFAFDVRNVGIDLNPATHKLYLSYEDAERSGEWHNVELVEFDSKGLFVADVAHFSNWNVQARPEQWSLDYNAPVVNEFSGAATYGHPIDIPSGRAGMQPNVTLSYSSRTIDGALASLGPQGDIAHGWSIAEMKIVRDGTEVKNVEFGNYTDCGNPNPSCYRAVVEHKDAFRLIMNGSGHELVPEPNSSLNNTVRYYAKDNPNIRVIRYYNTSAPNYDKLYWVVTTGDGTAYRFGYTADAEEYQSVDEDFRLIVSGHRGLDSGSTTAYSNRTTSGIAWRVDTVTDIWGNQMTYQYNHADTFENYADEGPNSSVDVKVHKARLSHIAYNYPNRQSISNGVISHTIGRFSSSSDNPASVVLFAHVAGGLNEWDHARKLSPITRIAVYHQKNLGLNVANPNKEPIAEYRIGTTLYAHSNSCNGGNPANTGTWAVTNIKHYGQTDSNLKADDTGVTLPATTFTYTPKPHESGCYTYRYLEKVSNGYGGSARFVYTSDSRSIGYGSTVPHPIGEHYFVTEQYTDDGFASTPESKVTYSYANPCYNQTDPDPYTAYGTPYGGSNCPIGQNVEYHGALSGFADVEMKVYSHAGTLLSRSETDFHLTGAYQGKPAAHTIYNSAGQTYASSATTYQQFTFGPTQFTRQSSSEQKTYDLTNINNYHINRTELTYDVGLQGGTQLGYATVIVNKIGDTYNAARDQRTTMRSYDPDLTSGVSNPTGRWLTGIQTSERLFNGLYTAASFNSGNHLLETVNTYDGGGTDCTDGAVYGVMCESKVGKSGSSFGGSSGGYIKNQRIQYDVYGNARETKDTRQLMTTNGLITTIDYDSTYHLYPTRMVVKDNGGTTYSELWFESYSFNETTTVYGTFNGAYRPYGLLKSVEQRINRNSTANTNWAYYEYDPFGRLYAVYDEASERGTLANNSDGDPAQRYGYYDNLWAGSVQTNPASNLPFPISVDSRPSSFSVGTTNYQFKQVMYHDGLGRVIQTQDRQAEVDGQSGRRDILTTTAYDARGLAICQTMPYQRATATGYDATACASKTHTTMQYDDLGRVSVITPPDADLATYHYYGLYDKTGLDASVTNNYNAVPNYHTDSTSDVIPSNEWFNVHSVIDANDHARTEIMNALGQLVYVTEYEGTSSPYSRYGTTAYGYDWQGNLERVIDEDDNLIKMTYDLLGRKTQMNDPDMGMWNYLYDASSNLTSQVDANEARLCFYYDAANRLTHKHHVGSSGNLCSGTAPTTPNLAKYTYDTADDGLGQVATISWGSVFVKTK